MNSKHGHCVARYKSPTYASWSSMKNRCDNPKDRRFHDYGGRGISYPPEWRDFSVFLADMGERPPNKSLDRIDNARSYSKENCRWATAQVQTRNRRVFSTNTSGATGVYRQRDGWRAEAYDNKKKITLYCGKSYAEAVAARRRFDAALASTTATGEG